MVAHPLIIATVLVVVAGLGIGTFVPVPGEYDVQIVVNSSATALIVGTFFSINSVTPSNIGQSKLLDWTSVGLSFAPPALNAQFSMTVCVGAGHCSTKSSTVFFPSLPVLNGGSVTATNTFIIGYVPGGQTQVTVSFYQNSQLVASGQSTCSVGTGSC